MGAERRRRRVGGRRWTGARRCAIAARRRAASGRRRRRRRRRDDKRGMRTLSGQVHNAIVHVGGDRVFVVTHIIGFTIIIVIIIIT